MIESFIHLLCHLLIYILKRRVGEIDLLYVISGVAEPPPKWPGVVGGRTTPWPFVGAKPPQKRHYTMFKIRQSTLKSKQFF